jgi:cytoplasmic iron level regulating protein YaaA (DUF328/UPF0246 family)
MILVLSPSKTLDSESAPKIQSTAQPEMLSASEELVATLRKMKEADIAKLMEISPKLAHLNYERFQSFQTPFTAKNARPALFAFRGDVYDGLDADSLSEKDVAFAQEHLRILSGLYGLLKPLDLMQPYRLEMGTGLKHKAHKNLYSFWGSRISDAINTAQKNEKQNILINLASEEYFKAVDVKALYAKIVTPVFKEKKGKDYKIVGLFAKKARGVMARYIIQNQILSPEKIKTFDGDGYRYQTSLSNESVFVFTR